MKETTKGPTFVSAHAPLKCTSKSLQEVKSPLRDTRRWGLDICHIVLLSTRSHSARGLPACPAELVTCKLSQ